ncbi:E3 ubiquitin-protein ligase rnf146 [Neocloeon triangulifer]|uniref:E3 ubiquitin-protein ligase rnf146 n=1 Tax=Neocloeon triangulifer TaxID=2078957 RepID=UPI00286F4B4A|nr:E3 ubiquitin-protein ligase rnf146 [Neocloeon triangulifer]XP_059469416.1 E3 ubiquitin-protein ligase rnf146 [Neocloeon triangulifer]
MSNRISNLLRRARRTRPTVQPDVYEVSDDSADEDVDEEESDEVTELSQASGPLNTSLNTSFSQQECSVCLSSIELPIRLPCTHYFCYTCAKGLAQTSRACAMCRRPIPSDFVHDPDKYVVGIIKEPNLEHAWFYEGANGWWMYEPRVQSEIEEAFLKGDQKVEALIAGHLYVLDMKDKVQYRKDLPSKRRRMKRDLPSSSHKGLAGLRQEMRPEFPPGKE